MVWGKRGYGMEMPMDWAAQRGEGGEQRAGYSRSRNAEWLQLSETGENGDRQSGSARK